MKYAIGNNKLCELMKIEYQFNRLHDLLKLLYQVNLRPVEALDYLYFLHGQGKLSGLIISADDSNRNKEHLKYCINPDDHSDITQNFENLMSEVEYQKSDEVLSTERELIQHIVLSSNKEGFSRHLFYLLGARVLQDLINEKNFQFYVYFFKQLSFEVCDVDNFLACLESSIATVSEENVEEAGGDGMEAKEGEVDEQDSFSNLSSDTSVEGINNFMQLPAWLEGLENKTPSEKTSILYDFNSKKSNFVFNGDDFRSILRSENASKFSKIALIFLFSKHANVQMFLESKSGLDIQLDLLEVINQHLAISLEDWIERTNLHVSCITSRVPTQQDFDRFNIMVSIWKSSQNFSGKLFVTPSFIKACQKGFFSKRELITQDLNEIETQWLSLMSTILTFDDFIALTIFLKIRLKNDARLPEACLNKPLDDRLEDALKQMYPIPADTLLLLAPRMTREQILAYAWKGIDKARIYYGENLLSEEKQYHLDCINKIALMLGHHFSDIDWSRNAQASHCYALCITPDSLSSMSPRAQVDFVVETKLVGWLDGFKVNLGYLTFKNDVTEDRIIMLDYFETLIKALSIYALDFLRSILSYCRDIRYLCSFEYIAPSKKVSSIPVARGLNDFFLIDKLRPIVAKQVKAIMSEKGTEPIVVKSSVAVAMTSEDKLPEAQAVTPSEACVHPWLILMRLIREDEMVCVKEKDINKVCMLPIQDLKKECDGYEAKNESQPLRAERTRLLIQAQQHISSHCKSLAIENIRAKRVTNVAILLNQLIDLYEQMKCNYSNEEQSPWSKVGVGFNLSAKERKLNLLTEAILAIKSIWIRIDCKSWNDGTYWYVSIEKKQALFQELDTSFALRNKLAPSAPPVPSLVDNFATCFQGPHAPITTVVAIKPDSKYQF